MDRYLGDIVRSNIVNEINNLSTRLKMVAKFLSEGTFFADIGSDHAYLPCYVCTKDKTAMAIAGEVNKGPFESAKKNVASQNLTTKIEVCLGNGLEVIQNKKVNEVVIAGMGGSLIRDILEAGKDNLVNVQRIIAQPNIGAPIVRKWLVDNKYKIVAEEIVAENGHVYEIIVADKATVNNFNHLSEKELLFGPYLLAEKSNEFYQKWQHELVSLEKIITQIKQASNVAERKLFRFEQELAWIKEVLSDE